MFSSPQELILGKTYLFKGVVNDIYPHTSRVGVFIQDVDPEALDTQRFSPFEIVVSMPWRCTTPPEPLPGEKVTFTAALVDKIHRPHGYNCTFIVNDAKYPECEHRFNTRHTTFVDVPPLSVDTLVVDASPPNDDTNLSDIPEVDTSSSPETPDA